ncbi:hypothetical protein [Aminobacter aminovorans]|uniref:hypothetical protein n=1 Tax=Aminobacter aminovorans TaxID=83263 RepID=UPI002855E0B8|nr:hypothetical protein [Aminobacter aminovorans]MDR7220359.1 hypothetical protein [Aminobacter aminovorans]
MRDLTFDIMGRDKSKPAFDSARGNAVALNGDLDRTSRLMSLAGNAAKGFLAGFSIATVAGVGRAIRDVVAEAAGLVDLADKVGIATDDLQRLTFGFTQAGVEAGNIEGILTQWSKRIGEAHISGGRLADILKANGVSLTNSEGRLRSSVDLMREYANLIANAASDQERATLAAEAFGRSGSDMVLALRDGADGFNRLMQEADAAGGVLDEEILKKAAEIDDEFEVMWRRFEINAKSAILSAVGMLDGLRDKFVDLEQRRNAAAAGWEVGALAGTKADPGWRDDRLKSPADRRINDAFKTAGDVETSAEIARMLRDRYAPKTIIPTKSDNDNRRGGGSRAEEISAYDRVIGKLREEKELLGLNSVQQRILSEQRRAGVSATSDQGKAIAAVITQIEAETTRLEQLEERQLAVNDAMQHLAGAGIDALFSWADGAESAGEAARRLAKDIARAVAYAALLGQGPLAGLFGGGGGILGSLFGGFRAGGGNVDPWKTYVVGEKGPELLRMGGSGGNVTSNDNAFGGGQSMHVTFGVDVDGNGNLLPFVKSVAQGEARQSTAQLGRNVPKMVDGRSKAQQLRGTRA